jgi:hypothetical protein
VRIAGKVAEPWLKTVFAKVEAAAVVVPTRTISELPLFEKLHAFAKKKWVVPLISSIGLVQFASKVQLLSVIREEAE